MSHEEHPKAALTFFASPLRPDHKVQQTRSSSPANNGVGLDVERSEEVPLPNPTDEQLHDMPAFQRHAEASNHELFFDLCKLKPSTTTIYASLILQSIHSLRGQPDNLHFTEGDQ